MATANPNVPEGDGGGAELSLRDTLAAAFDEAQGAHDDAQAPAAPAPSAPPGDDDAAAAAGAPAAPAAEGGAQGRDDKGRFTGTKAPAAAPQPTAPPVATARPGAPQPPANGAIAPAPPPTELKPPASWKPQARELWGSVAPEVQAEIHRREHEHQHTLQQAAGARQFVEAFERVVRPYEVFIRAENSTPLDAVDNLMRMAAVMRTGSPSDKVNVVANIIRQWSIDLPMLDSTLAAIQQGQPAPQFQGAQQQQFRDPRLDQLLAAQQQQAEQMRREAEAQLNSEIETFAGNPAHEFFNDVRTMMADLIAMAANRGQTLTMADAYAKACQLDDNVSKILSQRASARAAGANTNAALRARRAAASVKGDSTLNDGATIPKDDSIRASLEAAFEESAQRNAR